MHTHRKIKKRTRRQAIRKNLARKQSVHAAGDGSGVIQKGQALFHIRLIALNAVAAALRGSATRSSTGAPPLFPLVSPLAECLYPVDHIFRHA